MVKIINLTLFYLTIQLVPLPVVVKDKEVIPREGMQKLPGVSDFTIVTPERLLRGGERRLLSSARP